MKKSKVGIALILSGFFLLLIALGWSVVNLMEDRRAGEISVQLVNRLEALPPTEEPVLTLDGAHYCAQLEIEKLNLRLPVRNDWDMQYLKSTPCRYDGSMRTGDLIVAAHNYRNHFGGLHRLQAGDKVSLTDPSGTVYRYVVTDVSTLAGTDVVKMYDGEWDLTLFTCTRGGEHRTTVRCKAVQ